MQNIRFWIVLGVVIGAIWSFNGYEGALLAAGLGAVGMLVGLVLEQGVNLREVLRQDDQR